MFDIIRNKLFYFFRKLRNNLFFYIPVFKRAFFHYMNLFNVIYIIRSYKERNEYKKKLRQLDDRDKKVEEKNKEKIEQHYVMEQKKKKLKLEKERVYSQERRINFLNNFKKNVDSMLNTSVQYWVEHYGLYSYKCIESVVFKPKNFSYFSEKDPSSLKKLKKKLELNDDELFFEHISRHSERHKLSNNPFTLDVKWGDHVIRDALLKNQTHINETEKRKKNYSELLDLFRRIILLKTKIYIKKKKNLARKKNFLAKVLRVLLYVEDREAENLNEQLAKSFFYTRDVNYNFRVRSSNIKVKSLEWTIPSPPPLHTFYVPVRTIVTNDRFFNYKKGKRLVTNEYYNFKETPSVFQKLFRKCSKTFFLFRNYIYYSLGLADFEKNPNKWYSGSHNVTDVEEYPHTVEYVSQSIRYPYKHLSKHLPFSAGLHNNTISVDLLITPDKSNKVLFGEKKTYLSKPEYIKKKEKFIKPLFIVGDRSQHLLKVFTKKIENNYNEYKLILNTIYEELCKKGDGGYTSFYLPSLKKNSLHNFMWNNHVVEDPSRCGYFVNQINQFDTASIHVWDQIDIHCLSLDIKGKILSSNINYLGDSVKFFFQNVLFFFEKLKQHKYGSLLFDWWDQLDFSWTLDFFYLNFYIPYMVAVKLKRKKYFFRYFCYKFLVLPMLGAGWYCLIKSDYILIKCLMKKK